MATTLFELKEKMAELGSAIKEDAEWIAQKAANPETPMPDIEAKEAHRNDLQKRFDMIKAQHDDMETRQKLEVQQQEARKKEAQAASENPAVSVKMARGEFYKAVLTGGDVRKAYEMLGGIPAGDADLGYGDKLLPTNMSSELITEPLQENPMRNIVRMSNITGLEEPKLLFDYGDDSYDTITDKMTAKEIELTGDTIIYGRNKVKVRAKVSDTVLHGSTYALATEIDNALRSGLAVNEMNRMFAASPATGYKNMSFYSSENAVKEVAGATKQAAIAAALADLPIAYRRNASIVMSAADWYDMWGENLNQSGMFYEDRPLTLYGKSVVLVDDATYPIVGDFGYSRINYDIGTTYDTDKDIDQGVYKFVLTAWYDIRLRLASAFRIVKVNP